ncbi:MAG: hypothetical protein WC874_04220, partial [Candidatus Izemoplasmatales bacterium]
MTNYQIIKTGLLSKFAEDIDFVTPLNDYPRPQLVRSNWTNLNGLYEYTVLKKSVAFPDQFVGQILVPFAIESAASGVNMPL